MSCKAFFPMEGGGESIFEMKVVRMKQPKSFDSPPFPLTDFLIYSCF